MRPEDPDIKNYFHFLATNVLGRFKSIFCQMFLLKLHLILVKNNEIEGGTINYDYIPPFAFLYNPKDGLVEDLEFTHRMVALVFRQEERLDLPVQGDKLCSPAIFERLKVSKMNTCKISMHF